MKYRLTPAFVAKPPLPALGKDRVIFWEGNFGLQVTAKGHTSFVVQYRAGRQSRRMSLKAGLSLQEARREAKAILGAVARGGDPLGEKRKAETATSTTLRAVAEDYLEREGSKLRSVRRRKSALTRLVFPVLGNRQIDEIRRSDIVCLLDDIEPENGPHMAQQVLAFLSRIFNWYAASHDTFVPPIRRGMARTKLKDYARNRILNDDELHRVWQAAEAFPPGPYGPLMRFLLLTATRCNEAAQMEWTELSGSDWLIPGSRMKGKLPHLVPLSRAAKTLLDGLPRLGRFVFTLDGRRPTRNFDAYKSRLDEACGVNGWVLHDIRRTARSLLSRAGVAPDVSERCVAHAITGARSVYDHHDFRDEKAEAFERLAGLVERIVHSQPDVVVPIRRQA